ncbi:MAG: dihydropteroate synthase [Bacteroidetes bacterium RBG_13_43_22]|nr:MAG: dihydropteroate synthase [Bacteroidetes bacterium RBG_13_43_22]
MTKKPKYINAAGKLLDLSVPKVMGILNITPDSFYKGSRVMDEKEIIRIAAEMIKDGADILDIGGYSSRPGAADVSAEEEKKRVLMAISLIHKEFPDVILSIDTFRSEIAFEAVTSCGACIINDISGGEADKNMFSVVHTLNVPYIIMHMKGKPQNMQENPVYEDVVADILKWFGSRIVRLQSAGVKDIIIDPGFGFGKTVKHNFEMLDRLGDFSVAGLPLLAGVSRKSMIWKTLDINPDEALNGTTVINTIALMKGADILRVHDVREAVQAVRLIEKIKNTENRVLFQDR